ncbi:DeoR family lactose phosphotransferase system repressor [Enterococcus sp. PF1-24]|uniref:DeoR/GlpR family DNA-binding transcription regulator n=1 Tax=unclassified Enterococcus TaxID=2608891 RepID=UPI002474FF50|nr:MULTISPECIES: DeoR/GlpR family DNA-binding transcription regulator [unclassified Enterococcus]MDH6364845.1 DeoR family lactose phosphotransferase system repressor [Enterococcus sp. PFB1-1]MDH6401931.1 DeoR family lactose phosphotransferase system repressor [Enterococcus sp. PF1-24]
MLKQERQQEILNLIQKYTYLAISEIATRLEVSEMTIRRDVTELAQQKKLTKLYGGAQKIELLDKELSTDEKIQTNVEQKKYIGKIMNALIQDHSTLFIGAGTTNFYALSELNKKGLFIITNSLIAFNYLKENTDYRILLTGGELSATTEEFIGEVAIRSFDNLNIDIAFAATNGIIDNNVTTAQFEEGAVQNAAFEKSKITCVVADSSKMGVSDIYTFRPLSEFDYLITDNQISQEVLKHYSQYTTVLKEEPE